MKKLLLIISVMMLLTTSVFAQGGGFGSSIVIKDVDNNVITNSRNAQQLKLLENVSVKIINQGTIVSQQKLIDNLERFQNKFAYKFENCTNDCEVQIQAHESAQEKYEIKIQERDRFLFWDVVKEEVNIVDETGENVYEQKQNIWRRLLGD